MKKLLTISIPNLAIGLLLTVTSCVKEDTAITLPPTSGNVSSVWLQLGKDYTTQLFYNLSDGTMKGNDFHVWDIAFDCRPDGRTIIINGGKEVQVYNTKTKNFDAKPDPSKAEWTWDNPQGEWEGTAFGRWWDSTFRYSNGFVYLVDRGPNEPERFKKVKILNSNSHEYIILYANPDGTHQIMTNIEKRMGKNYIYFNFNTPENCVDIEPDNKKWDILFTRYRHIYYDMTPITPYIVTGVLLNPNMVECGKDSTTGFDKIDLTFAKKMKLTRQKDIIGFDWKKYDFNLGRYDVRRYITYIIKDTKGYFYKLRFIDFYDDQGVKGAPKFELQRL